MGNNYFMETTHHDLPYVQASPSHRLAGRAVDLGFSFVTLGIGWTIWSLVCWANGQTPGKQLLKMRVYATDRKKAASWGHMAVREYLIPASLGFVTLFIIVVVELLSSALNVPVIAAILAIFMYLAVIAAYFIDSFWILKGGKNQRVTDILAHTTVLNECIPNPSYIPTSI